MQGGEGECFYVVGSGEFEVLAIQVSIFIHIYLM
jgi:CRP-like cAMP-binding protein